MIVDLSTGNPIVENTVELYPKAKAGRLGGLKPGKARFDSFSPERRKGIAKKAAAQL